MTSLWIVLVVSGVIQGTAGPLPYGEAECAERAEEMTAEFVEKSAGKYDGPAFVWHCRKLTVKPKIGDKFND